MNAFARFFFPSSPVLLALALSAAACADDPETSSPTSDAGINTDASPADTDAPDPCDGLTPPSPGALADALAALPQFTISGRVFQNVSSDREGVLTVWVSTSPDLADLPQAAIQTLAFPPGPIPSATNYSVRAPLPAAAACLGVGDGVAYWVAAMVDADGSGDPANPSLDTLLGITSGGVGTQTADEVLANINVEVR